MDQRIVRCCRGPLGVGVGLLLVAAGGCGTRGRQDGPVARPEQPGDSVPDVSNLWPPKDLWSGNASPRNVEIRQIDMVEKTKAWEGLEIERGMKADELEHWRRFQIQPPETRLDRSQFKKWSSAGGQSDAP